MGSLLRWAVRLGLGHLPPEPRWRLAVPGITLADGTWMPAHERVVEFNGSTPIHELAAGGGNPWQRAAHAQLATQHPQWADIPLLHKAAHVLSLATDLCDAARGAAGFAKAHRWWTDGSAGEPLATTHCDPLHDFLTAPSLILEDDS